MPNLLKEAFKDPENPTEQEMENWLHSHPDRKWDPTPMEQPSIRTTPLTEITAQRLILSLEALTLTLLENNRLMSEPQLEERHETEEDPNAPPPSLMHPGKPER